MFISVALSNVFAQSPEELIVRPNYGIVFKRLGKGVQLCTDFWAHVIDYELPRMPRLTDLRERHNCPYGNTSQCDIHQMLVESLIETQNESTRRITALIQNIRDVFQSPHNDPLRLRKRFSLFPVLGVLSWLLGGPSDLDVAILEGRVAQNAARTSKALSVIEHQVGNLTSAVSITNKRISNVQSRLNQQTYLISDSVAKIGAGMINMAKAIKTISSSIMDFMLMEGQLEDILTAIEFLHAGKITPAAIHRSDLKAMLREINAVLRNQSAGFRTLVNRAEYFYNTNHFTATRVGDVIYTLLKIPITSLSVDFDVYEIQSMPVSSGTNLSYSTILETVPFVAFSANHEHYITFSQKPTFLTGNMLLAADVVLLNATVSCELALFLNDKDNVQKVCHAKFLPIPPPELTAINQSLFVFQNLESYQLICHPNDPVIYPGCSFCLVQIPQRCALNAAGRYFPPHQAVTGSHSVAHLLNLRMLQSWFDKAELTSIQSDTLFTSKFEINLPLEQLKSKMAVEDRQFTNDLDHLVHQIKTGTSEVDDQAQKLAHSVDTILLSPKTKSSSTWQSYLLVAVTALTCIFMTITLYLFWKVSRLSVLLISVRPVAADRLNPWTLRWLPPSTSTEASTTVAPSLQQTIAALFNSLTVFEILVLSVLTFMACLLLFQIIRRSRVKTITTISLKLVGQDDAINLLWFTLPDHHDKYVFTASTFIRDLSVECHCGLMSLVFNWDMSVGHRVIGSLIKPLQCLRVSRAQGRLLRRILSKKFCAYLYAEHNGKISKIRVKSRKVNENQASCSVETQC